MPKNQQKLKNQHAGNEPSEDFEQSFVTKQSFLASKMYGKNAVFNTMTIQHIFKKS